MSRYSKWLVDEVYILKIDSQHDKINTPADTVWGKMHPILSVFEKNK